MLVRIEWNPSPTELRRFGAVTLVAFGVAATCLHFGLWPARSPHLAASRACLAIALLFGFTGLTGTRVALPFYRAWMGVAWVMGNVSGRVILVLTWLLAIVPVGLVARLAGRDRLRLRRGDAASHWRDLPPAPTDPSGWERLF
jgi:hypothetical protein